MHQRVALSLILLLTISLFLPACHTATVSKSTDCADADFLCVGLVSGLGGTQDQSLSQKAWDGIVRAQSDKLVDRVERIETVDAKDYDSNIASLVEARFDIVVTVGDLYSEATTQAAQRYPDTLFVGVDQEHGESIPNLAALIFPQDQAGFQAGALAAQLTRTNTIAAVYGPESSPEVQSLSEGYDAGAKYINPDIEVMSNFYPHASEGFSSDPRWAANAAYQAIQKGADIIFDGGGMTGNGALVEAASHPATYCIGYNIDQWDLLPDAHSCLVSSSVKLVDQSTFEIIRQIRNVGFPSGNHFSATGLAPYHDFEAAIPQVVNDKMNQIAAGLIDGSISPLATQP